MEIEQQREHAYEFLALVQEATIELKRINENGEWQGGVDSLKALYKVYYEEFDKRGLL